MNKTKFISYGKNGRENFSGKVLFYNCRM